MPRRTPSWSDLKDKVKLNGFRPGKVPVSAPEEACMAALSWPRPSTRLIRDTNNGRSSPIAAFRLATEPKITMPTEQKEVEELLVRQDRPDLQRLRSRWCRRLQLADFKSFTVEKPVVDVSRFADVDDAIKRIADQNKALCREGRWCQGREPATASPCQLQGQHQRYELFDGGTGEGIPVVIGTGHLHSGVRGATGRHGGQGRDPYAESVDSPKNYASEKLAGQPAEFETTATLIEAPGETL